MKNVEVKCDNISKSFSGRTVFEKLSLHISSSHSLCITGKNGSGKSTLIKILSGLLQPSKGAVCILKDGAVVKPEERYLETGLVSPYLNLYDELTAFENLDFFLRLKTRTNGSTSNETINNVFEKIGLYEKRNVLLRNYSSGMKQRLKFAFAMINQPAVLLLDEPRTNLDASGIELLQRITEEQKQNGILIIGTNDSDDRLLCESILNIEEYGNG